jgi:hypothetical protein
VLETQGNPSVWLVVRAGSAADPPSREGLAYVVARSIAARAGADVTVGPDLVIFQTNNLPSLAAALAAPLDEGSLEFGKSQALAQLLTSDCADAAESIGRTWAFAGHPYGHADAGRLSTVPTLTLVEAQSFRDRTYVRGNSILGVDGPETVDVGAIEAVLAPLTSRSPTPAVWPRESRESAVVEAHVGAACTFVGWWDGNDAVRQSVADLALLVVPRSLPRIAAGSDGMRAVVVNETEVESALAAASAVWATTIVAPPASPSALPSAIALAFGRVDPQLRPFKPGPNPEFSVVRVSPDASALRAAESSATLVVLDRESVLR